MSKPTTNWFVITGGPSSGKTTLIEMLASRGYKTIAEAARTIIDEGLAKGLAVNEIRKDEKRFQEKVLKRKLDVEAKHDKNTLTFFDRGLHDSIAYLRLYDWGIDESVKKSIDRASYKRIFLLEPLPDFKKDYARTENPQLIKRLTILLEEAYKDAGMQPVRVPVLPPEERVQFVLQDIAQDTIINT